MEDSPLHFNVTKRLSRPVIIEDENGEQLHYELRELTVADREKYLTGMASRMRYTPDGKPVGVRSYNGAYAELLTRCMFKKNGEGWTPVTAKEIDKWGAVAGNAIFSAAQELNRIESGESEEAEAKNE